MSISTQRSRRVFLTQAAALVSATTGVAASLRQSSAPRAVRRLDRLDLLRYHDADGRVGAVTTPAQWQRRRAEILEGMQAVMGPLQVWKNPLVRLYVRGEKGAIEKRPFAEENPLAAM